MRFQLEFQTLGEDTPSPQFNEDSPKVGSDVEGSPEPGQQDEDERPLNREEIDKDHDPCRSDGTVYMNISHFDRLSEQLLSEPVFIRNLPW